MSRLPASASCAILIWRIPEVSNSSPHLSFHKKTRAAAEKQMGIEIHGDLSSRRAVTALTAMTADHKRTSQRRSLRQSLKDLLRCRRRRSSVEQPKLLGSGILRKSDPTTSLLPSISRLSLFPDFGSSTYNAACFSISSFHLAGVSSDEEIPTVSNQSLHNSTSSLLPTTRLSQFNLNQTFHDQAIPSQRVQYRSVPEALIQGASRQASVASYQTSLRNSTSTLKLQRSSQSLAPSERASVCDSQPSISRIRRSDSRRGLGQTVRTTGSSRPSVSKSTIRPPDRETGNRTGLPLTPIFPSSSPAIKHFSSFCVLDTLAPGCPVTATSEDLRYIFEVGEQFFLHNQECDGTSVDIVTGHDAAGNEVTHLVLFSPLVSPSSGRSRFMLAALIDVTNFLLDTASLPDLETISEESVEDEELRTPSSIVRPTPHAPWQTRYELSAEDLLGGCFVGDGMQEYRTPESKGAIDPRTTEDVWLKLATEEKRKKSPVQSDQRAARPSPPASTTSSSSSAVDNVLEEFMSSLQQLYSEFFLLAKSPLDDNFYEICNVSPSVLAGREYVEGHLSHTAAADIALLSQRLGGEAAFRMVVRWGGKGRARQLYCVPLFGQSSVTWICMLVSTSIGIVW